MYYITTVDIHRPQDTYMTFLKEDISGTIGGKTTNPSVCEQQNLELNWSAPLMLCNVKVWKGLILLLLLLLCVFVCVVYVFQRVLLVMTSSGSLHVRADKEKSAAQTLSYKIYKGITHSFINRWIMGHAVQKHYRNELLVRNTVFMFYLPLFLLSLK